jgi:hypothetical protein
MVAAVGSCLTVNSCHCHMLMRMHLALRAVTSHHVCDMNSHAAQRGCTACTRLSSLLCAPCVRQTTFRAGTARYSSVVYITCVMAAGSPL